MNTENGYLALLANIAEYLASVGVDDISEAVVSWRMRWLRSNPFA